MSKRGDVLEAARVLANTPDLLDREVTLAGVKCYVIEAGPVSDLIAAINAFDAYRAAELKAGGIRADGSSIHPSGQIG